VVSGVPDGRAIDEGRGGRAGLRPRGFLPAACGRLREGLARHRRWLEFREACREGWRRARARRAIQGRILGTRPVRTARGGPVEVRVLTWRRDWLNAAWALKSFYHFAGVDYPLVLHDGGLAPGQAGRLLRHFPDATVVGAAEADARVAEALGGRGLRRCLEYRARNISTRKVFDFYALSDAEYVVAIDPDIVFFARPAELIVPPGGVAVNRYNKDVGCAYSMDPDELEAAFGLRPPPGINSGLALVRRASVDFAAIDVWLAHPRLFADTWVTEQTLHALFSAAHGVELLPESYRVGTEPGLDPGLVCKHYPGFFRPLLYAEGMAHLVDAGFLGELAGEGRRCPGCW
jgi:hypothetical protein